jgi:hypothetical protein
MLYHPIIIPLTSKIDLDKTNPFEPGILAWPWSPSCIAANEVLILPCRERERSHILWSFNGDFIRISWKSKYIYMHID